MLDKKYIKQFPEDKTYIKHEKSVLGYWETHNIPKVVENNSKQNSNGFEFMVGPPFVSSSNLHVGHLTVGTAKDTMIKFKTMNDHNCSNKQGLDCHGLPSEGFASKQLNVHTSIAIKEYGIDKFIGFCKQMVNDCKDSWKPTFELIGRWVDFNDVYKTMDTNFMETVWWVFGQLYKKGLVYDGYKVLPYSTHCETSLSNFEASLNYKTVMTRTLYVKFKSRDISNTWFVAWTTTPFTLPSNIALCVGPDMQYMLCKDDKGDSYIVAQSAIPNLKKDFVTVEPFRLGKDMIGLEYEPLFNYLNFTYHKIVADSYVKDSADIGTGIVHIAPSFGSDDYRICLENNIITPQQLVDIDVIDSKGNYLQKVTDYHGMYVFDAEKSIINNLNSTNKIVRIQDYSHEYPFCYRSDTKLIYRAMSSIFVEVTKLSTRMVELNDKITWSREEIGKGRFKNWLEQAKDWCISRNRFFRTPIPIWRDDDGLETVVVSSIAELEKLANLDYKLTDLHLETISNITIKSNSGKILKLHGSIFDCWFESGAVPYAQLHYPFENSNAFDNREYLSDLVIEGLDQTRGWFYTLLVLATAISDKPPFKHVICTGIVLDEHGEKISKSKGNFVDPSILIDKYGSDVLRMFFLKSSLLNAEPMLFKESDVKNQLQQMTPYFGVVKFFLEHYINSQTKHNPIEIVYLMGDDDYDAGSYTLMDLWILEQVWLLRTNIQSHMNNYRIDLAVRKVIDFVDNLANWYVKFNRDRLKGLCGDDQAQLSLSVLFTVLFDYCVISAPFMPFLSEHVYNYVGQLLGENKLESVHMEAYPDVKRQHHMDTSFEKLQKLSKLIRSLRDTTSTHTSVKVPIKKCTLYHYDKNYLDELKALVSLIEDEVNCQDFEFVVIEESNTEQNLITYTLKPKHKLIGQEYRKLAKPITDTLTKLTQNEIKSLYNGTTNQVEISSLVPSISIEKSYFDIILTFNIPIKENTKTIEENGLLVCADMTYDEETHNASQIKILMSSIQNIRKEMKLNPWNKIKIHYYNVTFCTDFDKLVSDNKDTIIHKLGTQFYPTTEIFEKYHVFKYKQFGSNSENEIMIFVEVLQEQVVQ